MGETKSSRTIAPEGTMKRLGAIALFTLAACGTTDGGNHQELRALVDQATVSLGETVTRAEASVQYSAGVDARIHSADAQFSVDTVATGVRHDVRLDLAGTVLSRTAAGAAGAGCQTQIALPEALARAEREVGGNAVAVVPDDDDPCLREIQVLVDTTLWEVKLGPDGALIEKELSDEEL
jgi:hypothetical protein